MRKGGIVAFDNTLQGGKVIIEEEQAEHIVAIRNLNDKLSKDDRVTTVMMDIAVNGDAGILWLPSFRSKKYFVTNKIFLYGFIVEIIGEVSECLHQS